MKRVYYQAIHHKATMEQVEHLEASVLFFFFWEGGRKRDLPHLTTGFLSVTSSSRQPFLNIYKWLTPLPPPPPPLQKKDRIFSLTWFRCPMSSPLSSPFLASFQCSPTPIFPGWAGEAGAHTLGTIALYRCLSPQASIPRFRSTY